MKECYEFILRKNSRIFIDTVVYYAYYTFSINRMKTVYPVNNIATNAIIHITDSWTYNGL